MSEAPLQLTSNAREILQRYRRLDPAIQKGVAAGLGRALLLLETRCRTAFGVKARHGASGLSGRLTSYVATSSSGDLEGAIGFRKTRAFPYELSHEFGARAKPGGAMTVPVSSQARAASARGIGARQAFAGRSLAVVRAMGKAFLVEHLKNRSILHYVLIKRLPATLGFRKTVIAGIPLISQEIEAGASGQVAGV